MIAAQAMFKEDETIRIRTQDLLTKKKIRCVFANSQGRVYKIMNLKGVIFDINFIEDVDRAISA